MQVLESSSDGTLTHPALLKDRVTSPAGTTIAGERRKIGRPYPRGLCTGCVKGQLPGRTLSASDASVIYRHVWNVSNYAGTVAVWPLLLHGAVMVIVLFTDHGCAGKGCTHQLALPWGTRHLI